MQVHAPSPRNHRLCLMGSPYVLHTFSPFALHTLESSVFLSFISLLTTSSFPRSFYTLGFLEKVLFSFLVARAVFLGAELD